MSAIKHKYFPEMTTFSQVKFRIPKRTNICLLFSRISILNIVTFNVLSVILGGFGFQNTFFVLVHPCLGQQTLAAFLFPSLLPRNVFFFLAFQLHLYTLLFTPSFVPNCFKLFSTLLLDSFFGLHIH